jgi:hypothetical protein
LVKVVSRGGDQIINGNAPCPGDKSTGPA